MDEDFIHIVMGAPTLPHCEIPEMKPGMHGETHGPSAAEELLCQIKCMICDYLGDKMDDEGKMPKMEDADKGDEDVIQG